MNFGDSTAKSKLKDKYKFFNLDLNMILTNIYSSKTDVCKFCIKHKQSSLLEQYLRLPSHVKVRIVIT